MMSKQQYALQSTMKQVITLAGVLIALSCLSGCAVVAVVDAGVSVVANTVEVAADVVDGTVDLIVPDSE